MVAQRVIPAYRTCSHDVATLLAKRVPLDLAAENRTRVYIKIKEQKDAEETNKLTNRKMFQIKNFEEQRTNRLWKIKLLKKMETTNMSGWTLRALVPNMEEWLQCNHNNCNYRLTQLLTGHGSFAYFLYKIQKKENYNCEVCKVKNDAQHTTFECCMWARERETMYL